MSSIVFRRSGIDAELADAGLQTERYAWRTTT